MARRANALLLLDDGMSCAQIARVLFLDDDTVRGWHKQYLAEGWESVAYDGWKGGQSRTFGTERLTGALLDPLTHHVNILEMNGESYRLNQSRAKRLTP